MISNNFLFFWGHTPKDKNRVDKSCLSQWYEAAFEESGLKFHTSEHWMMYQKAILFDDIETAKQIITAKTPKEVKALGRKIESFDSNIWDEKKFTIVFHGNYLKFSQNTDLKEYLLSTSPLELVEASPYDKIWGIGLKADDPRARYKNTWQGENLLGQALVQVRTSIQREQVSEK